MGADSFKEPTILYVDDQPSHLALFKRAFQGDYLVLTAGSGEEGLEIIKDHDVFLVIADHNMPQMTGIDFLQKAHEVSPKSVQGILSAYSNEEISKDAARRAKLAQFLHKPWKLDRMRQFVEEAYRRYEQTQPTLGIELPPETSVERPTITWHQVAQLVESLEPRIDDHEARRVFLNFVEPRLMKIVPLIRRHVSPLLNAAHQEALKGTFDRLQKILTEYLRDLALESPDRLSESPPRVIH